jgi:hypothetical protein
MLRADGDSRFRPIMRHPSPLHRICPLSDVWPDEKKHNVRSRLPIIELLIASNMAHLLYNDSRHYKISLPGEFVPGVAILYSLRSD